MSDDIGEINEPEEFPKDSPDYIEIPDPQAADYIEVPDDVLPDGHSDNDRLPEIENNPYAPLETPEPQDTSDEDVTYHPRTGGPETLPDPEGEPLYEPHTPEAPSPYRRGPEGG